ncbi:NUDIX domain-containing protein [Candidatus Dojkabacteria bacterium]|nr:NUDIX domain-containing protein [Candidatus Dojkabacteria bacterium]
MNKIDSFHPLQLEILKKLLFNESLRFSDIKPDPEIENSQFVFHLQSLVQSRLVRKINRLYKLTRKGKELANRINEKSNNLKFQAKLSVIPVCAKTEKNNLKYLIYTRQKHPFLGCQGFLSGKVRYGEEVISATKRTLREETNLQAEAELIGIKHYRVYKNDTGELVEDKIMFVCKMANIKGILKNLKEGVNEWVDFRELENYIKKPFPQFREFLDIFNNYDGKITFSEHNQYVDVF